MIHLHVTKDVFLKIKNGSKKSEFRPDNDYYFKNVYKKFEQEKFNPFNRSIGVLSRIYCGYPKKDDKEKIIECIVYCVSFLNYGHKNIDTLFYKYYPNYKDSVMQIDFEVL